MGNNISPSCPSTDHYPHVPLAEDFFKDQADYIMYPPFQMHRKIPLPQGFQEHFVYGFKSKERVHLITSSKPTPDAKVCLWIHGNGTSVTTIGPYVQALKEDTNVDWAVFDYRGFGYSEGNWSFENCFRDLESVVGFLMEYGYRKENIILVGRSMGCRVALDFVIEHQWVEPIVLISPSFSINNSMKEKRLPKVKCGVKIISGTTDAITPLDHVKEVLAKIPEPIFKPKWIEGSGHNDLLEVLNPNDLSEVIEYQKKG